MVAQAVVPVHDALSELRGLYQRHATMALGIAVFIHVSMIGLYYLASQIAAESPTAWRVRYIDYTQLGPPPSLTRADLAPPMAVTVPTAKLPDGVPVPVVDAEVNVEQTIASQLERGAIAGTATGNNDGTVTAVGPPVDVPIEEESLLPREWVERPPIPVIEVVPEYPELARKLGIQGTVWIKVLVDKEGKARKAVVVRSDADIFDDPAVRAAMQWVFTPGMMNSGPVAVWAMVPFRFRLSN
jgi:TonB family protein